MEALSILAGFLGMAIIFDITLNDGDTLKSIFGRKPKQ